MKGMKKFLTSVLVVATLLASTLAVAACDSENLFENVDSDTQEASLIMGKAVEKILINNNIK